MSDNTTLPGHTAQAIQELATKPDRKSDQKRGPAADRGAFWVNRVGGSAGFEREVLGLGIEISR